MSVDNLCLTPWKAWTFLYVYANDGIQAHMVPIISSHVLQQNLALHDDLYLTKLTHMAMLVVNSKYMTFLVVPFLVRKYRATAEQMHALYCVSMHVFYSFKIGLLTVARKGRLARLRTSFS
jgi:hypothetical protein